MENISQPDTSGNTPTYDYNGLSEHQKTPPVDKGAGRDFDAGYSLLEPDEIDPNPGELPPDLRDGMQAALHAQLRGFDVIPMQQDGTPVDPDWRNAAMNDPGAIHARWASTPRCKVGGITSGLIVLRVSTEGLKQIETLAAGKLTYTAAVHSYVDESAVNSAPLPLLIFRLPDGIRSPEENISLAPGVDVRPDDGYIELPGGATDTCYWFNRRPIAMAPQWLVDKLAALAASQTERSEVMGAGAAAMEAFRKGQLSETGAPPIAVLPSGSDTPETNEPAERTDAVKDEKDTSEIGQQHSETAKVIPIRPQEEAVTPPSTAESPHYLQAYQWIESEAPSPISPTGRETLPKIAAYLRKQFDLPLSGTTELAKIWQHGECDEELPAEEIEQIVRRVYSAPSGSTAKPAGNTDMALGFLDGLDPSGRHDLATFEPTDCATFFFPNERESARRWIDARQGRKSIYASVNRGGDAPTNERLSQKGVAAIRAIVADIDIPKIGDSSGQHFRAMRAKLLEEVVPEIAKLECPPSTIVDSGGGVQLWWRLKEAAPSTPEDARRAEGIGRAINARIEEAFPGYQLDTVTDLPRVMRLPGTVNIPDAKKRPPTAKRQSKSSNEALPKIDMGLVKSAVEYEELPEELRTRFEAACAADDELQNLWDGKPTSWQNDISGSGFANALAWLLKGSAKFSPTEYGRLLWVWGKASREEKMDYRYIARTWARATPPVNTASGFGKSAEDDPTQLDSRNEPSSTERDAEPANAEWEDPTDFWTGESEPPDLPDGVVPEIVERFALDQRRRLGVEAGSPAACLISALTSAIPASNTLQMRQRDPQWTVKAINWTAIIAPSGSNKSATLNNAIGPLLALEKKWSNEFAKAKHAYDENERARKEAQDRDEPIPEPIPSPQRRRKIIRDTTTEALAALLSENSDGLFCPFDELSAFFGGMDTYKQSKGADRPFWLQMKEGGWYTVDRKGRAPIKIEHCAVSVLGVIQPDTLKPMVPNLTNDGLLQRFLPVYLKRFDHGEDIDPDNNLDKTVAGLAEVLSQIEGGHFKFTREADSERRHIEDFEARQRGRSDGPKFKDWLSKLPNEFGRLALAFHCIRWAALPERERGAFLPEMISLETATMARRFLVEFVYPHAREFYRSMLDRSASENHAIWIAEYILARKATEIAKRNIQQDYIKDPAKAGLIYHAMSVLEAHSWVTPLWTKKDGTPTKWKVNPRVHDGSFKEIADKEKLRRETERSRIAQGALRPRPATSDDVS